MNIASDWLRAGRSGDRIPVGARFSAPVQTGAGAHPASCTMVTGSFPGVKSGRGMTPTPSSAVVHLWAVRPVQSLSACTRVHFTSDCTLHSVLLARCVYSPSSSSCSGRIRFDSCSLNPQNEIGPSISSSVVLCAFVFWFIL